MKKPKWLSQNIRLFKCAASCANKAGNTALQTCVFSGNVNFQVPLICGAIFSDMNFVTKMQLNVFSFDIKCLSSYQMHTTKLIFRVRNHFVMFFRATMSFEMYRMFFQMTVITFAPKTEMINADCRMTILVSFR